MAIADRMEQITRVVQQTRKIMSRSNTYHVVGYGVARKVVENGQEIIRQTVEGAMSRLEIMQLSAYAEKAGRPIITWYAQTKTGIRILGDEAAEFLPVRTGDVPKVKTVECPRCRGAGKGCSICNFSGFTTRRHLHGFSEWQLIPG